MSFLKKAVKAIESAETMLREAIERERRTAFFHGYRAGADKWPAPLPSEDEITASAEVAFEAYRKEQQP